MLFHFQKDVFCLLYTMTEFFPWLREKKNHNILPSEGHSQEVRVYNQETSS